MVEIIGVRFNSAGKVYYFDPKGNQLEAGTRVLVETARGVEMGKVVTPNKMVEDREIVPPLKAIIRIAAEADFRQEEENKEKEKEAFDIAVQKIAEHKLDMKLVGAEYTFDRSKILFYFTADGRVDFRDLVKSLASVFRTRIELRQIGVRDEARQLGSLGLCGRFLCCSTFLNDFHPVSIKMAKEQGLSLNPTKISGVCGRLMCCLQYEQNAYDDMLRKMPRRGDKVETPDGVGTVVDTATLKGQVKVKFMDDKGDLVKFENYVLGDFQPCGKRCKCKLEREAPKVQPEEILEEIRHDEFEELTPELTAELAEVSGSETGAPKKSGRRPERRKEDRDGRTSGREGKPPEDRGGSGKDGENKPRRRSRPRRRGGSGKKGPGGNSGGPQSPPQNAGGGPAKPDSGGNGVSNGTGGYSGGYSR